jgi:hypothetical protein
MFTDDENINTSMADVFSYLFGLKQSGSKGSKNC